MIISRGSADSDDDVPSTTKISSRMNFTNGTIPKPTQRATSPRATSTNSKLVA